MINFKLLESETKKVGPITLFRLQATISFKSIKKGDKGGWIEKETNLSGDAWVYGDASSIKPIST